MPDNVVFVEDANSTPADGTVISTEEITTLNGSAVTAQHVQRVILAFRTGNGVSIDLPGDGTDGLKVQGSLSLPSGASTLAEQQTQSTRLGDLTETAPATDTASSGLNGRLQRLAQRLTSLIALFPSSIGQKTKAGSLSVTLSSDQDTVPVSAASLPLPSGGATSANQTTIIGHVDGIEGSLSSIDGKIVAVDTGAVVVSSSALPSGAATSANQSSEQALIGAINETSPATDTADSGLNGRLQRIAQRITSLIALLPTSLGQKTKANSLAVTIASDQDVLAVSLSSSPLPTGAATAANQATEIASLASIDGKITAVDTGAVVVASSALPSGAATSANQSTIIGHLDGVEGLLTTIDGDTGTLAGAVAGSEMQVDIVSGTISLPTGASTLSEQQAQSILIGAVDETAPASDTASSGLNGRLQRIAQRITSLIALFPTSLGQKTMANSLAVVVASDQTVIPISDNSSSLTVDGSVTANPTRPATATSSNVGSSATNVTLLASNANRLGATVYNDSTQILYLKLGATASATSHTLQMAAASYYEVPFWYTGNIDGIWASANGSARLVEVTA